jgi:hypothetical protein
MPTIGDIFDIPAQVHQGDFVLRLTEGVARPADTLRTYVVTPQLVSCFDRALDLISSALEANTSKGAYLHGSFGSGKSHFMAVLTLLLQHHPEARSITELAPVVTKHNRWTEGRKFLVVPYHMIGAPSLEAAVLGHYAEYVRALHPDAPTPGLYRAESLFEDARRLRATMGDEAFFAQLGGTPPADSGWGSLEAGWDADSFDAAMAAPPAAEERQRLIGNLIDAYFQSARTLAAGHSAAFVPLDEGLAVMSRHAQALGYDAVILFLDELILWLASQAADVAFVNREGQKIAKLVEAMTAERPIPLVSFIARQRDLRELVGEHLPGAEQLGFADVLTWWEARFDTITLEDRNLPTIMQKRLLCPKSTRAARQLQEAFDKTARVREEVMSILLTRSGDRDMFRQVYPFSPALVQTLVALSSLLQRERTALKLLLQLLVSQRHSLELGDLVPVGDLFEVIAEGDEPFTQAMRLNFDHARRLYRHKLLPLLEQEHGITAQDVRAGQVEVTRAQRFRTDDRLIKTLILSGLADGVEALHALTPSRLAALNHGTVRSPIPGQESQIVLHKCRNWAAQVGEIKISDDGPNPVISLHLAGVDTEGILANALSADNYGNRIRKAESVFFEQLGLQPQDGGLWPLQHEVLWRGTWRPYELLFRNVRELPLESFKVPAGLWRVVIDFPFDRDGYTPMDDRAQLQKFQDTGTATNCLVWLPAFFTHKTMEDLGRLVILDYVLTGHNLNQCGSHLSQLEREQARVLLHNQRDQMRQRLRNAMLAAYGVSTLYAEALDTTHELGQHVYSLHPALTPQPPVGASLTDALQHLLAQALAHQFPAHPRFEGEVKRADLRRVLDVVRRATQVRDGRVEVERSHREDVRRIAVPLRLGDMGETHFVLRDEWYSGFLRKQAEEGHPGLTVRRLRAWMEQPEAMGLPRDIQNLVLLSVALQGNLTFYLNGVPVQPQLEQLDDALELRAQALPDEALWQEATRRAATILEVPAPALLHATSVAQFVATVQQRAASYRPDLERLYQGLRCRLEALGVEAHTAPRLQTAQAALALVHRLSEADKDEVVEGIASAVLATSAAAMCEAVRTASEQATILEDSLWELFERLDQWPVERAPQARAVVETVKDLLTRDEHVMPLVRGIRAAQSAALDVLTAPAGAAAPLTSRRPAPLPPAPVAPPEATDSQRRLDLAAATAVFEGLARALAANPALVLDIDWRLYTQDDNTS